MTTARVPYWFSVIFAGAGLGILTFSATMGFSQHYRLASYRPVAARVLESRVQTVHGEKDTTYMPVIRYSYEVGGRRYEGDRVSVIGNYSSSGSRAWELCARYPVNLRTMAWVSPTNAASAFLDREGTWLPHAGAFFALVFLLIGVSLIYLRWHGSRGATPPRGDGSGWFELREERTIPARFRLYLGMAVVWYVFCGVVIGDYWMINGGRLDAFCKIAMLACELAGLIPLALAWRFWRLQHDFLDAELFTSGERIRAGDSLKLRMRQTLLRALEIEEVSVGVVCIRSDCTGSRGRRNYSSVEAWSAWQKIMGDRAGAAGEEVGGEAVLAIPADRDASSEPRDATYPFFAWFVGLRVKARGQPALHARYPIVMEAAAGD